MDIEPVPLDSFHLLRTIGRTPRVLALGEPVHGADRLLAARNELFRALVEQHDYRAIAVESDCLQGLLINEYVMSGLGNPSDVVANGWSHGWGNLSANLDMVRWMREYNTRHPEDPVIFAGFDGPLEMSSAASPRQALEGLYNYLGPTCTLPWTPEELDGLLGPDDLWSNPEAMMNADRSIGLSDAAITLMQVADDLSSLLETEGPRLREDSHHDWTRAQLYARTAIGLLRYHRRMAGSDPNRFAQLCGLRDSMMAHNLEALAAEKKTLVYAHNGHLQRPISSMPTWDGTIQWWSAGALLDSRIGNEYAFVHGGIGTLAFQPPTEHTVTPPAQETIEGALWRNNLETALVGSHHLCPYLTRESEWYGYAPVDPALLPHADALWFVRDAVVRIE